MLVKLFPLVVSEEDDKPDVQDFDAISHWGPEHCHFQLLHGISMQLISPASAHTVQVESCGMPVGKNIV